MLEKFRARSATSCLLAAAALGVVPSASATNALSTLQDITIESGTGHARIALNGPAISGRPGCHNASYIVHYGFDISTAKGKAMLNLANAAMLSGKRVGVAGSINCTSVGGPGGLSLETLTSIALYNN
jgi:hypothetical protein